ncbi:hypothetical protein QJE43_002132, partial [Salmonella enterica]|nr:hypothetical protein [Salmonella enterica]
FINSISRRFYAMYGENENRDVFDGSVSLFINEVIKSIHKLRAEGIVINTQRAISRITHCCHVILLSKIRGIFNDDLFNPNDNNDLVDCYNRDLVTSRVKNVFEKHKFHIVYFNAELIMDNLINYFYLIKTRNIIGAKSLLRLLEGHLVNEALKPIIASDSVYFHLFSDDNNPNLNLKPTLNLKKRGPIKRNVETKKLVSDITSATVEKYPNVSDHKLSQAIREHLSSKKNDISYNTIKKWVKERREQEGTTCNLEESYKGVISLVIP